MLYYNWSEITIEINNWKPVSTTASFDPFRDKKSGDTDLFIEVNYVSSLPAIDGNSIYSTSEYEIIKSGEREHKFFINSWNNQTYGLLKECCHTKKELYILDEYRYRIDKEMSFFNHLALERTMAMMGKWILHSSFIQVDGKAILFSAPSGTGKSTQASLWNQYREARICNGDRTAIWKDKDNQWYAGGVPWWGTSEITSHVTTPLLAIVFLKQAPDNIIRQPGIVEILKRLLSEITINPWNSKIKSDAQMSFLDLYGNVRLFELACRPDKDAVDLLAKELNI